MTDPQSGPDVSAASGRPKRKARFKRAHQSAQSIDTEALTARLADVEAKLEHALKGIEQLRHNQIRHKGTLDHLNFRVTDLYQQVSGPPRYRY